MNKNDKHPLYRASITLFIMPLIIFTTIGCNQNKQDCRISSQYYYQPLNPMTVWVTPDYDDDEEAANLSSDEFKDTLLRDLDTDTVRISLDDFQGNTSIKTSFGGASVKGRSYTLIVDYIKYFAGAKDVNFEYNTCYCDPNLVLPFNERIPIYLGVGLRVRAEFEALKSGIDISGLPALSIAASSNHVNGRLTVQTLGISGPEITDTFPIISDISVSSMQNALQVLASVKAKLYDKSTVVFPKLIAFETPEKDPALIKGITKELYAKDLYIKPTINRNKTPLNLEDDYVEILWFAENSEK